MAVAQVTFITQAPLNTIWSPPASCASQTPRVYGGDCNGQGCRATDISGFDAWEDDGYWTIGPSQVSTGCYPPSSQLVDGFTYSPAIGCPVGWSTASYDTTYSNYDYHTIAFCCPTNFDNIVSNIKHNAHYCWRTVAAAGETMNVVAYGWVSMYDSQESFSYRYASLSTISTTVVLPTATAGFTPYVSKNAIAMVIPASLATATPTATSTSSTSTGSSDDDDRGGVPFATIVGGVVGTVISVMFCLAIAYCCCITCRRKRRTLEDIERQRDAENERLRQLRAMVEHEHRDLVQRNEQLQLAREAERAKRVQAEREETAKKTREREEARRKEIRDAEHRERAAQNRRHMAEKQRQYAQWDKDATLAQLPAMHCRERNWVLRGYEWKIRIGHGPPPPDSMYAQIFDLGPKDALCSQHLSPANNAKKKRRKSLTAMPEMGDKQGPSSTDHAETTPGLKGRRRRIASHEVLIPSPDYTGMQDEGPRRGTPRLSRPTPLPSSRIIVPFGLSPSEVLGSKCDESAAGPRSWDSKTIWAHVVRAYGTSKSPYPRHGAPPPDYGGMHDEGPIRRHPKLSIPVSSPSARSQQNGLPEKAKRNSSGRFPVKPSSPVNGSFSSTAALADHPKPRKGRQYEQPRFSVGIGGVLEGTEKALPPAPQDTAGGGDRIFGADDFLRRLRESRQQREGEPSRSRNSDFDFA